MGFLKNMLMRKMIASKMKDVPQAEQDKLIGMIEKNPQFFEKIALEVQEEMKGGKDQMAATMAVMQKHKKELETIAKDTQ